MKIGPHVIKPTQAALDWAKRAPAVKAINDPTALRVAQPGAITIFRAYFNDQEQGQEDSDFVVDRILTDLGGFKPTFVELNNEFAQRIEWGLEQYCQFIWRCVQRFHAIGQMVAGFSNSTGQPEVADVLYMANWCDPSGVLRPFCEVDAWAKHEYWGKQGFSTWNALRYRRDHAILNGQHPPIIISECGRDAVEGGFAGWKLDGISGQQYMGEVLAYGAETEKDPYVISVHPFSSGPSPDWMNFDMDGDCRSIPGGKPEPIQFWVPNGGSTMAWDRHAAWNAAQSALGGQGANNSDAFGQAIEQGLVKGVGVFTGPYRGKGYGDDSCNYIWVTTSNGVLYVPAGNVQPGSVKFATSENSLPLA